MKCKHDLIEISRGFKTGMGSYSPTILKCKKCKKHFQILIGNPDRIIPIDILN